MISSVSKRLLKEKMPIHIGRLPGEAIAPFQRRIGSFLLESGDMTISTLAQLRPDWSERVLHGSPLYRTIFVASIPSYFLIPPG